VHGAAFPEKPIRSTQIAPPTLFPGQERDPTLDVLLDLDSQAPVVDPEGGHWIRFVVARVPVSPEKPHGLDYSLTLHDPNDRLVGLDNVHPVS
jgi:hypothetical protein